MDSLHKIALFGSSKTNHHRPVKPKKRSTGIPGAYFFHGHVSVSEVIDNLSSWKKGQFGGGQKRPLFIVLSEIAHFGTCICLACKKARYSSIFVFVCCASFQAEHVFLIRNLGEQTTKTSMESFSKIMFLLEASTRKKSVPRTPGLHV